MNSNLEEEKSMLKAGLGIAQQPCTKLLHFTADEIQNMKGAEMVTKSDEQRVAEVKQKYGNKEFLRGLQASECNGICRYITTNFKRYTVSSSSAPLQVTVQVASLGIHFLATHFHPTN